MHIDTALTPMRLSRRLRRAALATGIALVGIAATVAFLLVANTLLLDLRIARSIAAQIARVQTLPLPAPADPQPALAAFQQAARPDGSPPARAFVADIAGRIIMPGTTEWRSFRGQEFVSALEPRFEWNIRLDVLPGIWVHVIDRYQDGAGEIDARGLGLMTLIADTGLEPLNITQLARWLGMLPLVPDAGVLSGVIQLDDDGETLRTTDRGISVATHMARTPGRIVLSSADRFERYAPDVYHRTGSIITRSDFQAVDGILVPLSLSVIRIEPDGSETLFLEARYTNARMIR